MKLFDIVSPLPVPAGGGGRVWLAALLVAAVVVLAVVLLLVLRRRKKGVGVTEASAPVQKTEAEQKKKPHE